MTKYNSSISMKALIFFAAFALATPAFAAPTIDGVINDGEWNGVSGEIIVDDRQDNNGVGTAGVGGHRQDHADWVATWYVDWDDATLYYGIISRDGEVSEASPEGPQEIGQTWTDDSFEFWINTGLGRGDQADGPCECRHQSSYQILISVDEVLNDTQGNGESEGQQWDFGWDGNTVWKVNVPAGTTVNNPDDVDEGWSGEISVPFADMGIQGPLDGQTFGWNVTGMNYDTDAGARNRIVISWSNPAGIAPEGKAIDITSLHHNDLWGSIDFDRGAFYTADGEKTGGTAVEPIDKLATTWASVKSQ